VAADRPGPEERTEIAPEAVRDAVLPGRDEVIAGLTPHWLQRRDRELPRLRRLRGGFAVGHRSAIHINLERLAAIFLFALVDLEGKGSIGICRRLGHEIAGSRFYLVIGQQPQGFLWTGDSARGHRRRVG